MTVIDLKKCRIFSGGRVNYPYQQIPLYVSKYNSMLLEEAVSTLNLFQAAPKSNRPSSHCFITLTGNHRYVNTIFVLSVYSQSTLLTCRR